MFTSSYLHIPRIMVHTIKRFLRPILLLLLFISLFWIFHFTFSTSKSQNTDKNDFAKQRLFTEKQLESEQIVNHQQNPLNLNNQTKNYPNYYEDDLHPIWMFNITKTYDENVLRQWTEPKPTEYKSDKWTQGENGKAYEPTNEKEKEVMEKLLKEHNYNIFASERMSLHRSIPDNRLKESWSILLRTVWSIIDRSPRELLHEIILVDDASTWPELERPLDDYIELLPVNVTLIRTKQREGLIRARLIGAKNATGSVLTFLDAHMECSIGWLEPTLARIASDRSVVVIPVLHRIYSDDMRYFSSGELKLTGLRWYLIFFWLRIPERERLRTNNDKTAPLRTPSHVGCAFSIDREFFFEVGSYDDKMEIWGSENVELAFRVWMCGGSLEMLPCSRVGHLFRQSTYSFNGDENEIKLRNSVRLVEVWMDEYKDLFYASNPGTQKVSPGDLTERIELRNRLNCKSFRWYLENIYPESGYLKEYIDIGELKNVATDTCLDIYTTALFGKLIVYPCHGQGGTQFFALAKTGQIITVEELCVGVNEQASVVILVPCNEKNEPQLWDLNTENHLIVHRETKLCMRNNQTDVILDTCDSANCCALFPTHIF